MKIEITQKKLVELLNYLQVDSIFPFPILSIKNIAKDKDPEEFKVRSIQSTSNASAFRYIEFEKDYFKSYTKEEQSIKIDGNKMLKLAEKEEPNSIIVLEIKNDRLRMHGKRAHPDLPQILLEKRDIRKGLPFKMIKGIPHLKQGTIPLDTKINISLSSFQDMVAYASILDTEFFRFQVDSNGKFIVTIGDLEAGSEKVPYEPDATVVKYSRPVDVILTRGLKELSKTATSDININLRTNNPLWFSETSHQHKFGMLLPHYRLK